MMATEFGEITLSTSERRQIVDITGEVEGFVRGSGVSDGLCVAFLPPFDDRHSRERGGGGAEGGHPPQDRGGLPPRGAGWKHDRIDDNADAHLAGAALGPAVTLIIKAGRLVLGTWQRVLFIELDGPRSGRRIMLMAQG
jgi:thiamine phosphate synthase YjbQ (UPF0047 family)